MMATSSTTRRPRPRIIGERLAALIRLHRLTPGGAAQALGCSTLTLGRIVNGKRPASMEMVGRLKAWLGPRGWRFVTAKTHAMVAPLPQGFEVAPLPHRQAQVRTLDQDLDELLEDVELLGGDIAGEPAGPGERLG